MKKLSDNLFIVTQGELRNQKSSNYKEGSVIYVSNNSGGYNYIITLLKGTFSSFSLKSTVECANTHKYLTTPGTLRGMRPYYIDDFLGR